MQSVRLLANEAEYKRQILKYGKQTVKAKNDKGGLRIYSFSDAEMFHLIDIIQVITDSATVGLSLQGYTKVNEYAKAVKDTGEKLNRSLIPKGELGYHIEDGKVVLDYDTVEGIDINHPDFFDNKDNPNVGNITIGVSDTQIRAAMVSDFVDQIIPFHTGQSEDVLGEKGIATWSNYKDFQTEKDIATGKVSDHQINIYTEVLQPLEKEGNPITKRTFVEKFLQVCNENNLTPRFSQFLNTNENGDFVYTEGYHKMLVDFKTFAQTETGEYLPQMPVKPIFDNEYITKILKDYVKSQKIKDAELAKSMPKVIERITNEIVKPSETKFSDRDSSYLDAVNRGDMVTAQRMVDEAAKKAGYNSPKLFHGTTQFGFTQIKTEGVEEGIAWSPFFATNKIDTAKSYSGATVTRQIAEKYSVDSTDDLIYDFAYTVNKISGVYNFLSYDATNFDEVIELAEQGDIGDETLEKFNEIIDEFKYELYDNARYYEPGLDEETFFDSDEMEEFYEETSRLWEGLVNLATKGDEKSGNYQLYANTDNLLVIEGRNSNWNNVPLGDVISEFNEWWTKVKGYEPANNGYYRSGSTRSISEFAKYKGYSGVQIKDIWDDGGRSQKSVSEPSDVYIFFDPRSQVKSADPVTYDDNGNVIPLSERFKADNNDIRYSDRVTEDYSYDISNDNFFKDSKIYSYDFLVNQKPMKVLKLSDLSEIYTDKQIDRNRIVSEGKKMPLPKKEAR
jgi:hypothetical protein